MRPLSGSLPPFPRVAVMAVTLLPVSAILAVVLVGHLVADLSISEVMEDPADVFEGHPLTGAVSSIGILIWWSAAIACLFAYAIVPRDEASPRLRSFLLWSGLLTALLVLDDQFLFHEDLASRYLGLPQRGVVIAYLALAVLYVLRFRAVIRSLEWGLLVLAVGLLGGSLAVDYVHERIVFDITGQYLAPVIFLEDSLKLLGIAVWGAFYIRSSRIAVLRSRHADESSPVRVSEGDMRTSPRMTPTPKGTPLIAPRPSRVAHEKR